MKPKTELQKKVVGLSAKLKPITVRQSFWAFNNCFEKEAARSKMVLYCLECGHSWNDSSVMVSSIAGCTCPECGLDLKMKEMRTKYCSNKEYFGILTTKAGMQVVRMFYVSKGVRKGDPVYHSITEVMQHWIDESGVVTTMSLSVMGLSHYYDQWKLDSEMEVRNETERSILRYGLQPYKIYPVRGILPIVKRNGLRGHFYGMAPHILFSLILSSSFCETLYKSNQIEVLRAYKNSLNNIEGHWAQIKICIRNNYIIKDVKTWIDYIELLEYFNKDLHNPKFICPDNLDKEHDKLVKRKRDLQNKKRIKELRQQIEIDQIEFEETRSNFFGLSFEDGEINVKVLETVEEFMNEGDELKHCLFTNEYYKKPDSLILSARINNMPIETVEVSLSQMEVKQARGKNNKSTNYHDKIVKIVQNNIPKIANRLALTH